MLTVFIITHHSLKITIGFYCLIYDVYCKLCTSRQNVMQCCILSLSNEKRASPIIRDACFHWTTTIFNLWHCVNLYRFKSFLRVELIKYCLCKHITDAYRLSGCSKIEMAESNLTASTIIWGTEGLMALTNRGIPSTDSSIDFRPCYLNQKSERTRGKVELC